MRRYRLAPAFPGWFGHANPLAFADEFVPAAGARRFELGAPAVEAIYGARAGVKFVVPLGVGAHQAPQRLAALEVGADGEAETLVEDDPAASLRAERAAAEGAAWLAGAPGRLLDVVADGQNI